MLDHVPDKEVLAARGRNDFPAPAMWRVRIAGVVLQHPTAAALLKLCGFKALPRQSTPAAQLRRNPKTGRMERSERRSPMRSTVPNAWAFSRFMANVTHLERRTGMVSDLVPRLRRGELMRALTDYGKFMCADGKAIRSHSIGRTLKSRGRMSDPDADRGVHAHEGVDRHTGKTWERIASWFGCELHLIGDTKHELPVAFSVEKASVSEQTTLTRDLAALLNEDKPLAQRCREFSADRGYDQAELKRWLWDAHRIRPLIDIRMLWREDWDALLRRPDEPMMRPLDPARVDNVLHSEQGRVFRRCPATGTIRPMAYHGLDAKRSALKHLCPAAGLRFESHTIRGKARMTARVGLALAVMMALALGSVKAGEPQRMRSLVRVPLVPAALPPPALPPLTEQASELPLARASGKQAEPGCQQPETAPKAHESGPRSLTQPQIQANPPRKHPRTTSTPRKKAYSASVSAPCTLPTKPLWMLQFHLANLKYEDQPCWTCCSDNSPPF